MREEDGFRLALHGKSIPILVLDPKWHRLFAIHGKSETICELEQRLDGYLAEQGKCTQEMKDLKNLKNTLLDCIVRNIDGATEENTDPMQTKKLEENKRLIDDINEKLEACEDRLLDLPHQIQDTNENLMIASMDYCYDKIRINEKEAAEIAEWIKQVRVELKKNIIKKQDCEINSREIYAFMHDIFGAQVIDLFDMKYEEETE